MHFHELEWAVSRLPVGGPESFPYSAHCSSGSSCLSVRQWAFGGQKRPYPAPRSAMALSVSPGVRFFSGLALYPAGGCCSRQTSTFRLITLPVLPLSIMRNRLRHFQLHQTG